MTGQPIPADMRERDCVFSMHERDYLKDPRGALAKAREYAMVRVYGDDGLIFTLSLPRPFDDEAWTQ